MPSELSCLLQYKPLAVLERYKRDFPNNQMPPHEAFVELLKYFWLSLKHQDDKMQQPTNDALDFIFGIHQEMKEIDDMWHTFLLFTKEYQWFCDHHLGQFFHHTPTTQQEAEEILQNDFEVDFSRFLSYVYDNLGEQTVRKWFGSLIE